MRPPPVSLILVRNPVTHDARVLREAQTLRELGFQVLIAGVVSTAEPETELELEGIPVVRLAPAQALRRVAGLDGAPARRVRAAASDHPPVPHGAQSPTPASVRTPGPAVMARLRRLAITAAYYRQGIGLALRTSPVLVHANDYNTMWIGVAAKLLRRSRLVYDCHELWADRNGRPEWRPWLIACEALFVRVADATITTSPGYAEAISKRYRVAAPTVVRNIPAQARSRAPGPDVGGPHRCPDVGGPHRSPDRPLAVYVGGLMPGRGLESAIRALTHAPEFGLRLIGPGSDAYRARLRETAERAGAGDRLELAPAVAPSEVVEAIAGADLGLMLIEPVCRSYELTVPNKLFEYAAAGLPILSSDLPVIGPIVEADGLGAVVTPDDSQLIAKAMRHLAEPEYNTRTRDRVRSFARRVTWEQEKTVLERVYRGLVPGAVSDPERRRVAPAVSDHELRRLGDVYGRYAASPGKRRAWNAGNPGNAAIRDELADAVLALAGAELLAAGEILDIGCGSGWWLERLAVNDRLTAGLHGLELLPERVTAACNRVPSGQITAGDARSLPYDSGRFDVVTLFTVLSSLATLADVERVLDEARRVLRPGGALLIWEPRIRNPFNRATLFISPELLSRCLPSGRMNSRLTTVAPALARHLGPRTRELYPRLASIQPLLTHRLVCAREPLRTTRPPS